MAPVAGRLNIPSWASCGVHDGHVDGDVFEIFLMDRRSTDDDVTSWWTRSREAAFRSDRVVSIDSYALLVLLGDQLAATYDPSLPANADAARTIRSRPAFSEYFVSYYTVADIRRLLEGLCASRRVLGDLMPGKLIRLSSDGSVSLSASDTSTYALRARDALSALEQLASFMGRLLADAPDGSIVCFDGP